MTVPARVLLDTSVVIDLERLDLGSFASAAAAVSSVTIAELAYGLATDDPLRLAERVERYHTALEQFRALPFAVGEDVRHGCRTGPPVRAGSSPPPHGPADRRDGGRAADPIADQKPEGLRRARPAAHCRRHLTPAGQARPEPRLT